jgi:hypothetical protein
MHSLIKGKFFLYFFVVFFVAGCSTPKFDYAAFKQSNPRSILVVPPINESVEVGAELAVYSSVVKPLAEAGYYVVPPTLVSETFRQNGYSKPTEIHSIRLGRLKEIFGSDAVLFLTIKEYGQKFHIVSSSAIVRLEGRLVDIDTGVEIWNGTAVASSSEGRSSNAAGLVGLLVEAALTQVVGDLLDASYPTSKIAADRLFSPKYPNTLLYGPRHPKVGKNGS